MIQNPKVLFATSKLMKLQEERATDYYSERDSLPGMESLMPNLIDERLAPNLSDNKESKRLFDINPRDENKIGETSFDFRMGRIVAWADYVDEHIKSEDLKEMEHKVLDEGEPFEFKFDEDGDRIYYVESFEELEHSKGLEIEVHAKSTSGRVGCHIGGYESGNRLISIIQPIAFNLIGRCGKTEFAQGVVRYKGSGLADQKEVLKKGLVKMNGAKVSMTHKGLEMRFSTRKVYRAKRNDEPIDMDAKDLDWKKWWEMIEGNSKIVLDRKTLYLLGSLGEVEFGNVCGILSKEQKTFNGRGGFCCLAGVIQPYFKGEITMEPYFANRTVIHEGDTAGFVMLDEVAGNRIEKNYSGVYQSQKAPRLPKMFKAA